MKTLLHHSAIGFPFKTFACTLALAAGLQAQTAVQPVLAAASSSSAAAHGFNSSSAVEQTLHITIGHSTFINTQARLRRVYIANPAVVDSYTASPTQVVFTAKNPGISSVILWDEMGGSQAYMVSSDVNVEALRVSMKEAFPGDVIQVDGSEGRVMLTGTVGSGEIADSVVKLASLYAKDISNSLVINPARIKQVRLKVRIVEVDRSKLAQFGINIFGQGSQTIGQSTTGQFPSTVTSGSSSTSGTTTGNSTVSISSPLNFFLYSSQINVGVTIQDLVNKQVLQILSEPIITTLSGQKASFLSGGEFPFPVVQGGTAGLTSITIQFRSYGVKVEFTPVVNPDGTIDLKVAPEVSALDYTNAVEINGYTIPALSTRRADTRVVLRSGQSFAISGLLDKRTTDLMGSTPGISSIPILGQLFRSKSINHATTDLMVVVTPTVVDPLTDESIPTEPVPVIPTLDDKKFDDSLPAGTKKP
jgi:pilus assembly protein CpaC